MTVHQVKPEYTRIVAAIPHSVSDAHYWQWQGDPAVKAWRDRWTDWFTDELFGSRIPGVSVVKAKMSRLECDAERLEDEEDRLCRFAHIGKSERMQEWLLGNAMWRNMYLADWYRYRAEILDAAHEDATLIVDCHSFPSDLAPDVDVCIGFNEDCSKPGDATLEMVAQTFRDAGYSVAFNRPYANALAPKGYVGHSLMIEVNKRTYMDEAGLQKGNGFAKLKRTIRKLYHELLWMREHKPRNFSSPRDYPFGRPAAERAESWEVIKRELVRFTADRFGVAMPTDLSDAEDVVAKRAEMECVWGHPSWERSAAWLKLANAMLATVFERVGVTLPKDAFVQHYMAWRHMPTAWQERFRSEI